MLRVFLTSLCFAGLAQAAPVPPIDTFEVCTDENYCAIRAFDEEAKDGVWLVRERDLPLMSIWEGTFWLVPDEEYDSIARVIADKWTAPALNPTTKERATTPKTPPPPPSGPLVSGTITVTVGGGNCADCHTGSSKEIHKKVMDKKN